MTQIRQLFALAPLLFSGVGFAACPDWLDVEFPRLRSHEQVDLCALKGDRVLLIVNTASQCGFTPQFEGLEALYQRYRERGFEIVGFPSDSFRQEFDDEAETAKICYVNYGVTFTMLAPSPVRGDDANPVFAHLAEVLGPPRWNFYKYLIGRDGTPLASFPPTVKPLDEELVRAIEEAL